MPYGKASIKSYTVSVHRDRGNTYRRELRFITVPTEGAPLVRVIISFFESDPLTDLGSYSPVGKGVFARTILDDFEDTYHVVQTEKTAYFHFDSDAQNALTWFQVSTDEEIPGEGLRKRA